MVNGNSEAVVGQLDTDGSPYALGAASDQDSAVAHATRVNELAFYRLHGSLGELLPMRTVNVEPPSVNPDGQATADH